MMAIGKHSTPVSKDKVGGSPQHVIARLDCYVERWTELAKIEKSYQGLKNLIVH
jgi:hypothetical protein